jgi:DNA-binding transcriptional LysR family regulator
MEQNMPFDLDALLVFGKVVESRSLSKAAALLGMPKSTVSRKLTKLEADLGIKLLRKNTHQLTVTDLGEKVYAHAVNILTEANGVRALVEGSRQEPQGELRVAIPVFVGVDYASRVGATFPAAISPLAVGHPARRQHGGPDQGRVRRRVRDGPAAGFDADRAQGVQPRALPLCITGFR